jgi:lycopene cyclase domain-containing protein
MQNFLYLLILIFSLLGLFYVDYKYSLAWFWDRRKTAIILLLNLAFFLIWDIVNIGAGIIATNQDWVSGLHIITSNLPIEELLFLTLLGYQTLLLWRWRCLHTS